MRVPFQRLEELDKTSWSLRICETDDNCVIEPASRDIHRQMGCARKIDQTCVIEVLGDLVVELHWKRVVVGRHGVRTTSGLFEQKDSQFERG